ncbi:MAG: hypothetical protein ACHQCI_06720 [Solirubrobacterales bacterium]
MSLDGLRAWIGEVERRLGMRTRVFLVLVAIAVGGAGAAIYLAVEAENDQIGADDLRAVESRLQAEIGALQASSPEAGVTEPGPGTAALELQVKQLQSKVEALEEGKQPSSDAGKAEDETKP